MKFEDFKTGATYTSAKGHPPRQLVWRTPVALCFQLPDETLLIRDGRDDFTGWRPYTPPPAPVVRYVYAYENDGHIGPAVQIVKADADADPKRISPVVRVELPVDPDMLARVKGGAS